MSTDARPIIDGARSIPLRDAGLPGYLLAPCVDPDGVDHLWLIDTASLTEQYDQDHGQPYPLPAHEFPGQLPARTRQRIWGGQQRCGRRTRACRPCRQRVKMPGATCRLHASQVDREPHREGLP